MLYGSIIAAGKISFFIIAYCFSKLVFPVPYCSFSLLESQPISTFISWLSLGVSFFNGLCDAKATPEKTIEKLPLCQGFFNP
ncbi:MAG: hypothetical protein BGO76_00450 [Caedibacter sp. 38-128]|nr:MAG: hypothetical protein BGO76_00450 [Caedibacter sp. 38-128]